MLQSCGCAPFRNKNEIHNHITFTYKRVACTYTDIQTIKAQASDFRAQSHHAEMLCKRCVCVCVCRATALMIWRSCWPQLLVGWRGGGSIHEGPGGQQATPYKLQAGRTLPTCSGLGWPCLVGDRLQETTSETYHEELVGGCVLALGRELG